MPMLPPTFRFPQVGERQNGSFSSSSSMCPRNSHLLYLDHRRPSRGCECISQHACTSARSTEIDEVPAGTSMPWRSPISTGSFHGELPWKASLHLPDSGSHRTYRRISIGCRFCYASARCVYIYTNPCNGLLNAASNGRLPDMMTRGSSSRCVQCGTFFFWVCMCVCVSILQKDTDLKLCPADQNCILGFYYFLINDRSTKGT